MKKRPRVSCSIFLTAVLNQQKITGGRISLKETSSENYVMELYGPHKIKSVPHKNTHQSSTMNLFYS